MKQFYPKRTHRPIARALTVSAVALAALWSAVSWMAPDAATPAYASTPLTQPQLAAAARLGTPIDETAGGKPAAAPAQQATGGTMASIQRGLSSLLEAGNAFLTAQTLRVGNGDTLMDLLVRHRVPREQATEAIAALAKVYDPRALKPNHKITVFFHQDPFVADPEFRGLSIQQDAVSTVRVSRAEGGSYSAAKQEKQVRAETKAVRGAINGSLYVSAQAAGVPDGVILDLIKMYSFGVDFQREIQAGDTFEVLYTQNVTDAGERAPGREKVVYAKLTLSGRALPLYLHTDASGDDGYYDAAGQGVKKPLMRTPIDGARLSSGFGMRRHPVLGFTRMHKGVDFAAPTGTPIYAAGDGVVAKIGPAKGYGNFIRLRHRTGLETAYGHMSRFKPGLKQGMRVRQGEIIGYVGATGLASGPHLHYEVMVDNKQVNPVTVKVAGGKGLSGKALAAFKTQVARTDRTFKTLTRSTAVASN